MPLISVTAGRYSVYYGNSLNYLGVLDDSGIEISWTIKAKLANKTDGYADTLIGGYFSGADFRMRFVCKEFPSDLQAEGNLTSLDANWVGCNYTTGPLGPPQEDDNEDDDDEDTDPPAFVPARANNQVFGFIMPPVGAEFDQFAAPIVLNATAGSPTTASFSTLTALKTVPRTNQQRAITLSSKIRIVPVELDLLPYYLENGPLEGFNAWFTCT